MGEITARKTAVVALFAFVLGTAGFFNTFDISSGKTNSCYPHDIGSTKCPIASGSNCSAPPATTVVTPSTISPSVTGNACHVFTWSNFPTDTGFVPKTGLFNNDTTYDFGYNVTGVVEFSICMNLLGYFGDGNATLTLQYLNSTGSWINVAQNGGGTGGSITVVGIATPLNFCSPSMGVFPTPITTSCLLITGSNVCEFRIAGDDPITGPSATGDFIVMSELDIFFFQQGVTISNIVVCSSTIPTTASSTISCRKPITFTASQAINIGWWATNETSGAASECTVFGNCVRVGSGTCTILANANSCTLTASFSPVFTGTVRLFLDQSTNAGSGTVTSAPFGIKSLLP